MTKRFGELDWKKVNEELDRNWLIIPIGAIEQHGPHLPLCVDTILGEKISNDISKNFNAILAPTIIYGARSLPNSGGGFTYPGTIYIQGETLMNLYGDIIKNFILNGAKQILLLNGHWENEPFVIEAIEMCREQGFLNKSKIISLNWWSVVDEKDMMKIFGTFSGWHVEHAGQAETALMLHYVPELVNMKYAVDHDGNIPVGIYKYPTPDNWKGNQGVLSPTKHVTPQHGKQLSEIIKNRIIKLLNNEQSEVKI